MFVAIEPKGVKHIMIWYMAL